MADVSVVIPCYNGERFIAQTIDSVLAQTPADAVPREVIVIDDGSKDRSATIVERYAAQTKDAPLGRVTLIRQANAGESKARNVGIERAAGEFVAFLDADDLWMPEKTARQLDALRRFPGVVGVHARVFNFERELDDRARAETERTKDDPSVEDLIRYHYVAPSSAVVRRSVLFDRGIRFNEATRYSEDMLFMADLRLAGPLRLVDEPLVAKRVHAAQQSAHVWHPIFSMESRAKWVRERAEALGPELTARLDDWLAGSMVGVLEDRYWRRQVEGFEEARARVAALYPHRLAASKVAGRRIMPRWVYRFRDAFSR